MSDECANHAECSKVPTSWPFQPTCYLVARALSRASELQQHTEPADRLQPHEDYLLMHLAAEVYALRARLAAFEAREEAMQELLRLLTAWHERGEATLAQVLDAADDVRDFPLQPSAAPAECAECDGCGDDGESSCIHCGGTGKAPSAAEAKPVNAGEPQLYADLRATNLQLQGKVLHLEGELQCCKEHRNRLLDEIDGASQLAEQKPLTAEPSAADGGAVDAALRQIDKRQQHAEQGSDLGSARILAAEVRRLRELVKFREGEVVTLLEYQRTLEAERDRAWAELANVRAAEAEATCRVAMLSAERDAAVERRAAVVCALQRLYEDVTR